MPAPHGTLIPSAAAAFLLLLSPHALAAPSAARTARALVAANDALLLAQSATGADPELERISSKLEAHASAWQSAAPGVGRWFAELSLRPAEREWAIMLHQHIQDVSICITAEGSAFEQDVSRGIGKLPSVLLDALWYRAVIDPDSGSVGAALAANPDVDRHLPPETHALLGRLVGATRAGIDAQAELRAALIEPTPSAWTRLRYSEVLRHRGEGALSQARLALAEAPDDCVRLRAFSAISVNPAATFGDRLDAVERARSLLESLESVHPGDVSLVHDLAAVDMVRAHLREELPADSRPQQP